MAPTRRTLPFLAAVALTGLLVACGGGGGSGGGGGGDNGSQTPTAIGIGDPPTSVAFTDAGRTYHGAALSSGTNSEGQTAERLLSYLQAHVSGGPWQAGPNFTWSHHPGLPIFAAPPVIRVASDVPADFRQTVGDIVTAINAALPADQHLRIGPPAPPRAALTDIPDGEIFIDLTPTEAQWNLPDRSYRPGSEAVAEQDIIVNFDPVDDRWEHDGMRAGHVWISEHTQPNAMYSTVLHELIHALGLSGHIDHERFPDSIMRDQYLLVTDALPNIDGEALNVAYTRLAPGTEPEELSLDSFGRWDTTRFHLRGEFPETDTAFGASTRNGIVSVWASGLQPATSLADNPALSGTVAWNGALLGFTPADHTVSGDAEIRVELVALTGSAMFTGLESWGVRAVPGSAGTGTQWLDGDLGYMIAIEANGFRNTSGDAGTLTGTFVGADHDGAVGTLERTDLTAAFGGTR